MAASVHSRAPLRIGLGGGGTDLPAFTRTDTGAVLNATISLYAHVSVHPSQQHSVVFDARDVGVHTVCPSGVRAITDALPLHAGVHNRLVAEGLLAPAARYVLTTRVDVAPGSGLGSSSALTVAMVAAVTCFGGTRLDPPRLAQLAHDIERLDVGLSGGRQDPYAAAFGGVNLMEFGSEATTVTPVAVSRRLELASRLLLFRTPVTRRSGDIIDEQQRAIDGPESAAHAHMLHMRAHAYLMRDVLVGGELDEVGPLIRSGMEHKLAITADIGSGGVRELIDIAERSGAAACKVSGAGGGGFLLAVVEPGDHDRVTDALVEHGCEPQPFGFVDEGAQVWRASR